MHASAACIPNIGPRQRRRRLVMGLVLTVLTFGAAAWLIGSDAPRGWRLVLFVPAWVAALDFFQVRAKTCVVLAARGARNMDAGNQAIAHASELIAVRRQARKVHIQSAAAAGAVTAAIMILR